VQRVINFDNEGRADVIKRQTSGKGAICIDAVGYEAVGHAGSGKNGHDHSKVSNPVYEPSNPLQVIN
jgi:S-(hydroxymethyl)glutathione dehydrogenase/alcohol dehydrogenase